MPVYAAQGLFTRQSLLMDLLTAPAIIAGVFLGRWMLPWFSEKTFGVAILVLTALGALNLIVKF